MCYGSLKSRNVIGTVIIAPSIKCLKAVIPRLARGIHMELDAPIKSEHDMLHLYSCRCNNHRLNKIISYPNVSPKKPVMLKKAEICYYL
jgi:hypothetical protein